jgi:hypothetical protein
MPERKSFLLRVDPDTFDAVQKWAADDLRSVNGQVEFLLRRALREAGRLKGDRQSMGETEPGASDEPAEG